jgi:dTDP-4-dehydrorhamnose 3,5-epimerase
MKFVETSIPGTYLIHIEPHNDERGFFGRSWCVNEFREHGLNERLVQCNISFNIKKGTLRGMHYQLPPYAEAKLIRCTRGAIYDVAVDLRPDSVSFKHWISVELTSVNLQMLYIPEGVAHGFQTIVDNSEVFYQMSELYNAQSGQGVRWNDPAFAIKWPYDDPIISIRDTQFPDFAQ